ncbi:hypothetical protein VitviT2T_029494 [Vitis vinifera]|uniref:Uncharacterized protein n=1 Tax=Vitis vinifera TaxID=29760 RepID=A0ABY9DXZ6_VITVI|nr:hypothetical protein VitviT2T_029494 [Vitis vinifera]
MGKGSTMSIPYCAKGQGLVTGLRSFRRLSTVESSQSPLRLITSDDRGNLDSMYCINVSPDPETVSKPYCRTSILGMRIGVSTHTIQTDMHLWCRANRM